MIQTFYMDMNPVPESLYKDYPGFVHLGVMSSRMETTNTAKQLLNCVKRYEHFNDIASGSGVSQWASYT